MASDNTDVEFVTSAEITRNFGFWQERAAQHPLAITRHGRPRYMLVDIDRWDTLNSEATNGAQQAAPHDLKFELLLKHIDGGLIVLDHDLVVTESSCEATMLVGQADEPIIGKSIGEIGRRFGFGSTIAAIGHVLRTGEAKTFDLIGDDDHVPLRVSAFLWPSGVALIVRAFQEDRVETVMIEHSAMERARAEHGLVTAVRLTVRGTIAKAEPSFAALVGLTRERITGARFADLVIAADRAAARDTIEAVLSGTASARALDCKLLTNAGREVPIRASIAPLADGFAVNGAMMVITDRTHYLG